MFYNGVVMFVYGNRQSGRGILNRVRKGWSNEMGISTVKDRLELRLQAVGSSKANFARKIGAEPQNITHWQNRNQIPVSWLYKAARFLKCDAEWLATGHGDPELSPQEGVREVVVHAYDIRTWKEQEELDPTVEVLVSSYDVKLSAGPGAINPEFVRTEYRIPFQVEYLRRRSLVASNLKLMKVRGESMEPTIADAATVMIDTSQTNVIDGKIYALVLGEECKIKRLRKRFDGGLIVMSDSTAPQYADEEVPPDGTEHVMILGRVVWSANDH